MTMVITGKSIDRRTFLVAGGLGFFGLNLANAAAYGTAPAGRPTARSWRITPNGHSISAT